MLLSSGPCGQSVLHSRALHSQGVQTAAIRLRHQQVPQHAARTIQTRKQLLRISALETAVAAPEQAVQHQQPQSSTSIPSDLSHASQVSSDGSPSSGSATLPATTMSTGTARYAPATVTNLLVVEIFAGSYSGGRLAARLNSSSSGIRVSAYAAVELDPKSIKRAPEKSVYGIPDHENRTLLINGSVTDSVVHGQLLRFVQRMLQQSTDGSGPVIDGVMVMGGPPCTMYSDCQRWLLPTIIEPNPEAFRRKVIASDRVVIAFLQLYSTIKAVCADADRAHPVTKKPVPSCLLMENPWSNDEIPIKFTRQEVAASNGRLKPGQIKMIMMQNLGERPFLQPYLAHEGGPIYRTLHCWCSYAHITHPKKPTYVFSDLPGVQDTQCICFKCRPAGRYENVGKVQKEIYNQHFVKIVDLATGDGGERATWPDAWLDRMAWLFGTHILVQRNGNSSRLPGDINPQLQQKIMSINSRVAKTSNNSNSSNTGGSSNSSSGSSTSSIQTSSNSNSSSSGSDSESQISSNGASSINTVRSNSPGSSKPEHQGRRRRISSNNRHNSSSSSTAGSIGSGTSCIQTSSHSSELQSSTGGSSTLDCSPQTGSIGSSSNTISIASRAAACQGTSSMPGHLQGRRRRLINRANS